MYTDRYVYINTYACVYIYMYIYIYIQFDDDGIRTNTHAHTHAHETSRPRVSCVHSIGIFPHCHTPGRHDLRKNSC